MIEGLIIVGVAAIVIIVALFGTTLYASVGAAITSVTAMVTSAITGTATLLTAWWYWAIATDITTYYVGWFWLATWASLFAYSSFKIATSDKKKWMNLVGRGSNYLGVILILFLVAQPLAVSYGVTYLADTTQVSAIDHVIQTTYAVTDPYFTLTNATTVYGEAQTPTFDNDTMEVIIASADFDTVISPTAGTMGFYNNITEILATGTPMRIDIKYNYVGTGNITGFVFNRYSPSAVAIYTAPATRAFANNGTVSIILESFQIQQIKAVVKTSCVFTFTDSSNLPSDGDYIAVSIVYYESATIMSQATIMMWFAGIMALVDLIGLLYATGALQKYIL